MERLDAIKKCDAMINSPSVDIAKNIGFSVEENGFASFKGMKDLMVTCKNALEELQAYEDAEEQGLLLRLPCKVGDIFYCIAGEQVKRIHKMEVLDVNPFGGIYYEDDGEDEIVKIYNIYLDGNIGYLHCKFSDIGKTVFLTKEEAEQALKQMGE